MGIIQNKEKNMSRLFESSKINAMTLSNRFVRSATWEGMADDTGAVTGKLIETMSALAEGGAGLIITGHSYISREGQAGTRQLGVYKDELISGLKEMTAAVHSHGSKIVMQLAHAGQSAFVKLTENTPLAVSIIQNITPAQCREITAGDIKKIISDFTSGAMRAQAAGFDGVQLHSGHGYLLSQFLSPAYNLRQDEYGGDINNRARIHIEIIKTIRDLAGSNFPILMKLNSRDYIENGLELEDAIQAGLLFAEAGIDAIELSGGTISSGRLSPSRTAINTPEKEAYFMEDAKTFRSKVNIPLILVGGMRSLGVAEKCIENGSADYISLSRPFIREPNLINRWKSGDRNNAACISCNRCFGPTIKGEGVYCVAAAQAKSDS
jgi:2,4-dienoyl-CoA reductase-like NADH-dependent reductase (Old Yellow Enzyme family)